MLRCFLDLSKSKKIACEIETNKMQEKLRENPLQKARTSDGKSSPESSMVTKICGYGLQEEGVKFLGVIITI